MEKFIIEFEEFTHRSGYGHDSNSGMNDTGGYYWNSQTLIFNSQQEAKEFYDKRKNNKSFYRDWKTSRASLQLIEL